MPRPRIARPWSEPDKHALARLLLVDGRDYPEVAAILDRDETECLAVAGMLPARQYRAAPPPAGPTRFRVRCPNCGRSWEARDRGQRYCSHPCRAAATRNEHGLAI